MHFIIHYIFVLLDTQISEGAKRSFEEDRRIIECFTVSRQTPIFQLSSSCTLLDLTRNISMTNKLQNQPKHYCHLERGIRLHSS